MITRLEVDGFKSLRDFAIDLEPLTVLVGPNSAGKSNILEALALLSRLSSMSVVDAFKQGRGKIVDQFTRSGGEAGKTVRFAVEVAIEATIEPLAEGSPLPKRYRYEVTIERRARQSGAEDLAVAHESLRAIVTGGEEATRDVLEQRNARGRKRTVAIAAEREDSGVEEYIVPRSHTALSARRNHLASFVLERNLTPEEALKLDELKELLEVRTRAEVVSRLIQVYEKQHGSLEPSPSRPNRFHAAIDAVADELSHYRVIHLDASRLRDTSERIEADVLLPDASNLPTILADLPEPVLGEIRADLVSLIPGLSSFDVVPDDDSFRIELELSGGERLPARLVSDGTLRALALLTALRVEPRATILGIEEPENGVFPGRLRALLRFLQENTARVDDENENDEEGGRGGSATTQMLLTTHSPIVLETFRAKDESCLRFIDLVRRDGRLSTRARRVGVVEKPEQGAWIVSRREVDALLDAAGTEAAE